MPSDHPRFSCPTCGKSYRWKPEMAGRSAKCGCGGTLKVPVEQPAVVAATVQAAAPQKPVASAAPRVRPLDGETSTATCPICKSTYPAEAVLCVKCGYNFKTGKRIAAVVVETDDADDDAADDPKAGQ